VLVLGLVSGVGVGLGVRLCWSACPRMGVRAWGLPLFGGLPLLLFPFLPVGVALLAALFPARLFCGVFVFLACSVAGCQVASRLSSRSVSFPLFFSYYTIVFRVYPVFFRYFYLCFCADSLSIARSSGGRQAPTSPHSLEVRMRSRWLKRNHLNG
jgi:hypothetical protein